MKVLVTGGAGYLGSILTRKLLDAGHQVRVLDKLLFGKGSLKDLETNNHFQLMVGDIVNLQDVMAAMADIDAVIDLAAIVGDYACQANEKLALQTNYWATKTLAEVAKSENAVRFLFASTCSVYGKTEHGYSTEESLTNPLSLYAETKINSERALIDVTNSFKPIILRLSTLCGPSRRMRFDLVLNIMTATAYFENEVRIFGGQQFRPLLDVRDAADAFLLFIETPKEELEYNIYNVGHSKHNITIGELGRRIATTAGNIPVIEKQDVSDQRSYKVDFSRFQKHNLNYPISFEESTHDILSLFNNQTVTDYKNNRYYNARYNYLSDSVE